MATIQANNLAEQVKNLPAAAGVYLLKDAAGMTVYIGKAASLRQRVRSYCSIRPDDMPKLRVLKKRIAAVEYITTPTEVEALLLEAQLIQRFRPRYNTLLKDNKSYPLLKISGDEFPRIMITRERQKTEDTRARYYGPYTDARLLREAVRLLNALFPIRKCVVMPNHPCLYYYLNQCLAPCFRPAVKAEYDRHIHDIEDFLRGDKKSFIDYLTRRMKESAAHLRYEEADMFKRQVSALSNLKLRSYRIADPGRAIGLSGSIEIKRMLKLRRLPERIACFDVSNIHGRWAVASRVAFFRELPDTQYYRRYRIRTISGIDDYAMINEAVTRMCRGMREGREAFKPDLVIIDGGKGHLNVAIQALAREGYAHLPCIAIAKQHEEVFTGGTSEPLPFAAESAALNLIRRIRDEAHRFAISYHRSLRGKEVSASRLDEIEGVGPKRKEALLRRFGSVEAMAAASEEEIAEVPEISAAIARAIATALRKPKE